MTEENLPQEAPTPIMTDRTYNVLRWVSQYYLPAAGTLYFTLAGIWGLPYGEQIVGTLSAISLFIGVIIGISSRQYAKSGAGTDGTMLLDDSDPNKDVFQLHLDTPLETLINKSSITFKVDATNMPARRENTGYIE